MDANGLGQGSQGNQISQQLKDMMAKPPYKDLVRPGNIARFDFLTDDKKRNYADGTQKLWEAITRQAPEEKSHQDAVEKLRQLTAALIRQGRAAQAQANPQANSARPASQGQQQPPAQPAPDVRGQQQQTTNQQQQQQNVQRNLQSQQQQQQSWQSNQDQLTWGDIPQNFRDEADRINWLVPPDQERPQIYREELKRRFASSQYAKHNAAQALRQIAGKASQTGQPLPQQLLGVQKAHQDRLNRAQTFLQQVIKQQEALQKAAHQLGNNASNPGQQGTQSGGNGGVPLPQSAQVEAARQQMNRPGSSSLQAQNPAGPSNPQQGVSPSSQPSQQDSTFTSNRPPNLPSAGNFTQSPQSSVPQSAAPNQPIAHTTQSAIDAAARSYSSGGTQQQPGSTSSTSTQPNSSQSFNRTEIERQNQNTANRWQMDKKFNPPAPQPVSMPPSRPTLTGGNNAPAGMMGQPAIQQAPAYSLHGAGDRVLDKKKLDELVRQVCGGSGEGLHPEVAESVLQLADEFFDNVVTNACKLAKMRGAATLEIRDIQLVLQRQYNIRIPGYATDEIRTVRKVQPTASYLQKMNAVQAAKVMSGKTDI